jgi:hypothetical protein
VVGSADLVINAATYPMAESSEAAAAGLAMYKKSPGSLQGCIHDGDMAFWQCRQTLRNGRNPGFAHIRSQNT